MRNPIGNFEKSFYTVKEINELAVNSPEKLVENSEDIFKSRVKKVIDYIIDNKGKCKIVLITGPSSSGKTTFSKILREELREHGIWNDIVSLDNFYRSLENIPILEDGSHDFETIEGLDVGKIKKVLLDLLKNGKGEISLYDFDTMSNTGEKIHIDVPKDGIILVEGLHAINPMITEGILDKDLLRLYIDVDDEIRSSNGDNFIKPEDIRFMRRICRDYRYRHTLPVRTVMMWKNVRRGEELYIKPLKSYANFIINTFHDYEPCVMVKDTISCLNLVPRNPSIEKFKEKLSMFYSISKDLVPKNSLIREFI